jgi:hypothetical protein
MKWQPAKTMPPDRVVEVRTVTGLHRLARKSDYKLKKADKWGPTRQHCWNYPNTGDLMAVEWRDWQI